MDVHVSSDGSLSQRTRLVLLFSSLLALLFVALATWLPARLNEQSRALVEVRALELARVTAASAEAALDFEDRLNAMKVLETLRHTRGATYAVLTREGGAELASWGDRPAGLPLGQDGGEETAERGGLLSVRVPLSTRLGHRGALNVGFALDDLEERHRETREFVAIACLVVFAAGLLLTLLIGTLLVRPLLAITGIARRIAAGEVAAVGELPLGRSDEVGAVARALAHLLDRLYGQKATIEALAENLELRVKDRTEQLQEANRELSARLLELKQTQEQLIHADRRLSIGRLAAGVAHEINNPLAFMLANMEFAEDAIPASVSMLRGGAGLAQVEPRIEKIRQAIADSREGAERVRHIVRGLKTFARADDDSRFPVSVADALSAAISMAAHQLKHRARLEQEISPAPLVDGNHVRLTQVLLNLLLNAAQAIPEDAPNGVIRVKLGTDARGWAAVEVQDNGAGIHDAHLPHIFEPFFTTKPVGSGTGLGLSISQGIVLALGGEISVRSAIGAGTTFRVTLPPASSQEEPPPPPRPEPSPPSPDRPRARLLVIDDEPLVGTAVQRALEAQHDVVLATSGREALELIGGGARFDHILCDIMMPEMTGMDFHAELSRLAPLQAIAVTFMTGGPFTQAASAFVERYPGVWLEKPLDLEKLRRIVDAKA